MTFDDLKKHADLKVLSVILAFTLWLAVAGNREAEMTISAHLVAGRVPPGLTVASGAPESVDVTLSGPKILLLKLRGEKIIMPLDMQGLREGRVLFTGFERRLSLPREVSVTRVYPASVEVVLIRVAGKSNP